MSIALESIKFRNVNAAAYFSSFGGTALGLRIAEEISKIFENVNTPNHVIISVTDFLASGFETVQFDLERILNKRVVCKLSGTREAFSPYSVRGSNTSIINPRFTIAPDLNHDTIITQMPTEQLLDYKAIILQEMVSVLNSLSCIVHADGTKVILEVTYGKKRYLYLSEKEGEISFSESTQSDRSTQPIDEKENIQALIDLHWKLQREIKFPLNTEGFYENSIFTITQLRPIPQDTYIDMTIQKRIDVLLANTTIDVTTTLTHFVWGRFDFEGMVVGSQEVKTIAETQMLIVTWNGEQTTLSSPPLYITQKLKDLDHQGNGIPLEIYEEIRALILRARPWENDALRERITRDLPTVVIDCENGFHLDHQPESLPPPGLLRDNYNTIAVPWMLPEDLIHRRVRVLSDGQRGLFCLLKP